MDYIKEYKKCDSDFLEGVLKTCEENENKFWTTYQEKGKRLRTMKKENADTNAIAAQNKAYEQAKNAYNSAYNDIEICMVANIMHDYNLTQDIAQKCVNKGYERGHSAGYHEVIDYAREYADFADSIVGIVNGN